MAIRVKQVSPDHLRQTVAPIKYLTENGFSIVRRSEIDPSVIDTPVGCRFLVQHEQNVEREITVGFREIRLETHRLREFRNPFVRAFLRNERHAEVIMLGGIAAIEAHGLA